MTAALEPFAGSTLLAGATPEETREKVRAAALRIADEYQAGVNGVRAHLDGLHAAAQKMEAAFAAIDAAGIDPFNRFDLDVRYENSRIYWPSDKKDRYEDVFRKMRRNGWEMLVRHLGIRNLMSVRKREEFDRSLESGDLPDITPENVLQTVLGLADRAAEFAAEAAKEVFEILRPSVNASGQGYKTNKAFRVGRRVVLARHVERRWDRGFRPSYYHEKHLTAVDGVFHLLDGRGALKTDRKPPLLLAIEGCQDGRGETDFFRFKCFKNGNLHLEFRRPDLVKELNGLAAGEYVLGEDEG